MENLKVNNQEVIDTLGNFVFSNYDEAIEFATDDWGWDEDELQDGNEEISLKLDDGSNIRIKLPCIYKDPGSVDYIFYIS